MNRITIFLFSLIFLSAVVSPAQKVKYKDLIILLNAKEYEKAEPFLKKYLKDHDDNPNAYLFLGIIFQEKAAKEDVLKDTELVIQHSDSAIINFEIANKTIDEREVRRNDEYYIAYNRRDMRTGEFGVTLSDVKLDIEKRIQWVKDRKNNVGKLKDYYLNAEKFYAESIQKFKDIKGTLTEHKFYLLSDDKTVQKLKDFGALYDSSITAFENYKSTSKLVGKTGYNQILSFHPIKSFATDGLTGADFTKDDLKLWDFKTWVVKSLGLIEDEIKGIRSELIQTDADINQLGVKLKKDSVSVRSRLEDIVSKFLIAKLKKYDDDPLPLAIFNMKISELEYGSLLMQHKKLKDSLDVNLKLSLVRSELLSAKKLDSISSALNARNIDEEAFSYSDFINRAYGNASVIKSLVSALKEFAEHEIELKQKEMELKSKSLDWILVGADSIPLILNTKNNKYKMVLVKPNEFTIGLKFGADSLATGYFYTITPSRIPDVSANFGVDKVNFKKKNLSVLKSLSIDDGKHQIYFGLIYSEEKMKDKYPVTLVKVYRSDGLAWSFNYSLDSMPTEVSFSQETGELSIKLTNESKIVVVDKNGKLVR